jgi:membrane protein
MKENRILGFIKNKVEKLISWAKNITFWGFDGIPLYNVAIFFFKGIQKGALTTRASSIAFNFFLAVFPAIIFFFTLIPYIPIDNFQQELMNILKDVLPNNAYLSVKETIEDIIIHKRGGLLSFGAIAALYFSTNGINSMIGAFNATYHSIENRKWYMQRLVSLFLVLILFLLLTVAITLIVFSHTVLSYFVQIGLLELDATYYFLMGGKWVIVLALFFFVISFIYYLAPSGKTKWRFISAGSSFATVLSIIISVGFSFFVNNFGQYNKLYGSIGTLIVILIWLYFNALILLIGFELNASIKVSSKNTLDKQKFNV